MKEIPRMAIEEVEIDAASARILVRPVVAPSEHYEYIYRTGTGVRWVPEQRALAPYEVGGMSPAWWFGQIVAAVRSEYGQRLELRPETRWTSVPEETRREIEAIVAQHAV